jgi:hypothetical protein
MVWLNRGSANPSLESSISSFYKLDHLMLCNVLGGKISSVWLLCLRDLPTLILVSAFIEQENKSETTRALPV